MDIIVQYEYNKREKKKGDTNKCSDEITYKYILNTDVPFSIFFYFSYQLKKLTFDIFVQIFF